VGTLGSWFSWDIGVKDWVSITDPANVLHGTVGVHQTLRNFYKSGVSYLLGVNGPSDNPKVWDGTSTYYADMGGSPPRAACMACGLNYVMLGNLFYGGVYQPLQVDVSAFNDFDSGWLSTQTVNLSETPGAIVVMQEFGNLNIIIYKTDSIYTAIPVAQLYPYTFQLTQTGIRGPAGPLCVVPTPYGHFYISDDANIYWFNGTYATPLSKSIQAHIVNTYNPNYLANSWGYYDTKRQLLFFIYCGIGSVVPNQGLCIDTLNNNAVWPISWTNLRMTAGRYNTLETATRIGDMTLPLSSYPVSLTSLNTTGIVMLWADQSGQIYQEAPYATTDGTDAIPFLWETGLANLGSGRQWVTLQEMEHYFVSAPNSQPITIQAGLSNYGEKPAYTAPYLIDIGAPVGYAPAGGPYITRYRNTTRMVSLLASGEATQNIQWRGTVANGAPRGQR
jgi:hypothetical protein